MPARSIRPLSPEASTWASRLVRLRVATTLAVMLAIAGPIRAQYTAPGSSRPSGDIPPKETLEKKVEEAPWATGGLRLQPWAGIRNAAFVTVEGSDQALDEDDFTLTAGVGLRAYLPVGGKVYWAAHALPEYVWWSELEDRRKVNGRYGLGVFGYFNRLRLEASFRLQETQGFFSNEIRRLTTTKDETSRLAGELDLGSRFLLVGRFEQKDQSNQIDEDLFLDILDREERKTLFDLRYRLPRGVTLGVGWEERSTEFSSSGRMLDNTAEGGRLLVAAQGNRIQGTLELAFLSFEPDADSIFPSTDETLGELGIVWNLGRRLDMLNYARRDLSYAVDADSAYYLGERLGVRLVFDLRFANLGLILETGQDDFQPLGNGSDRVDDVTELGLTFDFTIGRYLTLGFDLYETEYDSNLDAFDRDVTNVGFRVELGRLLEKLSLGSAGGNW